MSPLEITLLLHIYACRAAIPDRHYPAQQSALNGFVDDGLVTVAEKCPQDEHPFALTDRGRAMVNAWLSLPLPRRRVMWITEAPEALITDLPPSRGGNEEKT